MAAEPAGSRVRIEDIVWLTEPLRAVVLVRCPVPALCTGDEVELVRAGGGRRPVVIRGTGFTPLFAVPAIDHGPMCTLLLGDDLGRDEVRVGDVLAVPPGSEAANRPPPAFRDVLVNRAERYTLGIQTGTGRHYLAIEVAGRYVDHEEYYALDRAEFDRFRADPDSALEFVQRCRAHQVDERLIRGTGPG